MVTIDTLVEDIQKVLTDGVEVSQEKAKAFGEAISNMIVSRLTPAVREPKLRMSNIGSPCERKLWYEINGYEKEELSADAKLKFLYGDLIEELLLFLAEAAGHLVEGRQDTLVIEGVEGHRDAIIDGVLVDVKSASTYSFNKFRDGKLEEDDPFGYITQLQSYLHASTTDARVTDGTRAAFLVADKTLGHLTLDVHKRKDWNIEDAYRRRIDAVHSPTIPDRAYPDYPDGKSGNRKLGTFCSYCAFKSSCWPSLRTYLYSSGPVFLTNVSREPNVPEVI